MSFIEKFNYNRNKITDTVSDTSISSNLKNVVDHAYGFRKIHPDYAGYCCRLRKVSADAAQNDTFLDFKFDKNQKLSLDSTGYTTDTQTLVGTLSSWVGSETGELEILYDQGLIGQADSSEAINLVHYTGHVYHTNGSRLDRNRSSSISQTNDTDNVAHTNPLIVSGGALQMSNGAPTAKLTGKGIMHFDGGTGANGIASGLHSDNGGTAEVFVMGKLSPAASNNQRLNETDTVGTNSDQSQYAGNFLIGGHISSYIQDMAIGSNTVSADDARMYFYYENGAGRGNAITGQALNTTDTLLLSAFVNPTTAGFKVNNFRQTGQFDGGVEAEPVGVGASRTPKILLLGGPSFADPTNVGKGEFQELIFSTQTLSDAQRIGVENYMASYFNSFSLDASSLTAQEKSSLGFNIFKPTYGAQISFRAENSSWKGSSFYQFISPMGLNNIKLRSKLSFINNLTRTKKLLNYIESITTGALTGEQAFTGDISYLNFGSPKNGIEISFDTGYYKNFSGSQIMDYSVVDLSDDVYKVDVSLFNNTISPVLNNGMAFVNDLTKDEKSTTGFSKFDVIKSTGTNEFKWYCFKDGTAEIAVPFTGTTVHQESFDGASTSVSISPTTTPTRAEVSITAGNVLRGDKYIHAMDRGDHHHIVPFSTSGKTFGFIESRYDPHEVFVLALEDGAQVEMYTGQNGVNDTVIDTLNLNAGGTGSFDVNAPSEDAVVILKSNKNIICSRDGNGGDSAILTPVDVDVYRRRKLNDGALAERTTINASPTTVTDHYVSDPNGVFTSEAGDGAGGDAAGHLGLNLLTNFASWGATLVDYAIVSPFSGSIDVSYYTGDSWQVLNTHSLNGSKTAPDYIFRNGGGAVDTNGTTDQAGDGTKFSVNGDLPTLWKFESTCPVGIWINDASAEEEVLIGTNNFLEKGQTIFDDYFYVTKDQEAIGPIAGEDSFTGSNGATRTFFWEPDKNVPLTVQHGNRSIAFKNSFTKTLNVSDNQNNINQIELSFTHRSEKETYAILHFLESHLGYKHFVYYHDNDAINKNRVFYCPSWDHTLVYKDSNNIKATFVEIVAPTIPR